MSDFKAKMSQIYFAGALHQTLLGTQGGEILGVNRKGLVWLMNA